MEKVEKAVAFFFSFDISRSQGVHSFASYSVLVPLLLQTLSTLMGVTA
jgi:hypothetical protein